MRTEWTSTMKLILVTTAVIALALVITHTDEIGAWIVKNLLSGTYSNLQQILE